MGTSRLHFRFRSHFRFFLFFLFLLTAPEVLASSNRFGEKEEEKPLGQSLRSTEFGAWFIDSLPGLLSGSMVGAMLCFLFRWDKSPNMCYYLLMIFGVFDILLGLNFAFLLKGFDDLSNTQREVPQTNIWANWSFALSGSGLWRLVVAALSRVNSPCVQPVFRHGLYAWLVPFAVTLPLGFAYQLGLPSAALVGRLIWLEMERRKVEGTGTGVGNGNQVGVAAVAVSLASVAPSISGEQASAQL